MNHLPLARQYRPRHFEEMAGQSHVLKALSHALNHQRLHHAYLLTGTRGVGKTSLARILAKCLNCQNGVSASPCNQCSACQSIDAGRYTDVIEIDAASRTKVEDTRELLDNVQYAPQQGRFKIYIIDEVHMLSGHSFNALLKTLEEPPAHVKFILATTDPQKLPVTVLSRCLQFYLKNISVSQISAQLELVLNKENILYEKSALTIIAEAAQGSLRDALSLLDQAISHGEGQVQEKNIHHMLGGVSDQAIATLLSHIHAKQKPEILQLIEEFEVQGADFFILIDKLLNLLQKIAVSQFTNVSDKDNNESELSAFCPKDISPEDIQLYYQIALLGKRDLPLAPDPKSGFTMVMIRMAVFRPEKPEENNRVLPAQTQTQTLTSAPISAPVESAENTAIATAPAPLPVASIASSSENWQAIIPQLKLSGLAKLLAQNCVLSQMNKQQITLLLEPSHSAVLTDSAKERLTHALREYIQNSACKIIITLQKSDLKTPFQQTSEENSQKIKTLETTLFSNKTVQSVLQTFSATLVADSISTTEE